MIDDLTDKQKKRHIKRIHDALFEVHDTQNDKQIVSLQERFMVVFDSHFPDSVEMNIDGLEKCVIECTHEITEMLVNENESINESFAKIVVLKIIMQFITQALSVIETYDKSDYDYSYG